MLIKHTLNNCIASFLTTFKDKRMMQNNIAFVTTKHNQEEQKENKRTYIQEISLHYAT